MGSLRVGLNHTFMQPKDAITKTLRFGEIVRDVQGRHSGVTTDGFKDRANLRATGIIQRAERFVEAQDAWLERQGASQGDPLGFAATEAGRQPIEEG